MTAFYTLIATVLLTNTVYAGNNLTCPNGQTRRAQCTYLAERQTDLGGVATPVRNFLLCSSSPSSDNFVLVLDARIHPSIPALASFSLIHQPAEPILYWVDSQEKRMIEVAVDATENHHGSFNINFARLVSEEWPSRKPLNIGDFKCTP